jgi:hypothetical protein
MPPETALGQNGAHILRNRSNTTALDGYGKGNAPLAKQLAEGVSSNNWKLFHNINLLWICFFGTHKSTRELKQDFGGQRRTPKNFSSHIQAVQRMSALPTKADIRGAYKMSAKCQKQT